MALAVHCQLNPQVRLFVPTVMAPKLAYRRGKREGGEEPVSKHQIRSGDGRWEERRGVGWLNPRRETKTKGRNGDREKESMLPDFFFCSLFPVQQTTSGIGHRVK